MKNLGKGALVGLVIEILAGAVMAVMVIANWPVPDVIAWIFGIGLLGVLVSCVLSLGKRKR